MRRVLPLGVLPHSYLRWRLTVAVSPVAAADTYYNICCYIVYVALPLSDPSPCSLSPSRRCGSTVSGVGVRCWLCFFACVYSHCIPNHAGDCLISLPPLAVVDTVVCVFRPAATFPLYIRRRLPVLRFHCLRAFPLAARPLHTLPPRRSLPDLSIVLSFPRPDLDSGPVRCPPSSAFLYSRTPARRFVLSLVLCRHRPRTPQLKQSCIAAAAPTTHICTTYTVVVISLVSHAAIAMYQQRISSSLISSHCATPQSSLVRFVACITTPPYAVPIVVLDGLHAFSLLSTCKRGHDMRANVSEMVGVGWSARGGAMACGWWRRPRRARV
ncbi:hypothetical protein VTO73DRAFT_10744 [Trametes versicolor]